MHFNKMGLPANSAPFVLSNPLNVAGSSAQLQPSSLRSFANISGLDQSYINPFLSMATIKQQGEQFVGSGIDQLTNRQENLNLLNALIKGSTSNTPNAQRISTLLTEQQSREAEAHRLQFLDFNSLHTNSLAGTSTLLAQEKHRQNNSIGYNIPKLPSQTVFNMVENPLIEKFKSPNTTTTSNSSITQCEKNAAGTSQIGVLPHQPYYPTHFMRGTLVQTSTDSKKLVETLKGEDFQNLTDIASTAHQKEMCVGVVMSLKPVEPNGRHVDIVFKTEIVTENGDLEISTWTINTPIEYPFFEVNKYWASFNPTKSLNLYGLECEQLKVGDCCLVLTSDQDSQNPEPTTQRLSPIPETSSRSESQLSVVSTENRKVAYFSTEDVEIDDHVII